MTLSPLQLEKSSFVKVEVACNPGLVQEDQHKTHFDVEVLDCSSAAGLPRRWFVMLGVTIRPSDSARAPFRGRVEIIGTFTVDDKWPPEQIEKLVYINGSGILYAGVREMVASITARMLFEELTLPSWSFSAMFNERLAKNQIESASETVAKQPLTP